MKLNLDNDRGCFLLLGSIGKGKTNCCRYLLLKNALDNFRGSAKYEFGIVFSGTAFDGDYDFIPDEYVFQQYSQETLENYTAGLEAMVEKGEKIPRNFVVLDDLIGLLNKHDPFLINWLAKIRHYKTHVYLMAQHLKTGANTLLREITTHAFCFSSKSFNTLQSLYENFGQLCESFDEFKSIFMSTTKEPFTAMLYIQANDNIAQNYLTFRCPDTTNWDFKLEY